MTARAPRLDDRIRELCPEAVAAKSTHMARPILADLQSAIRQYTHRLRARAAVLLAPRVEFPVDRRKNERDRRQHYTA